MFPVIISIEGNIGSGKSTIMKYLASNFTSFAKENGKNVKICYLQEPVDIWNNFTDKNNINIIENYYKDQKKYAFPFQMMAYISRLSQLKKALNENYDIIFTERSMYTDKNVFAKMLYDDNLIDEIEYKIYNEWFDEFCECLKNIKVFYVKTDATICSQRIKKRLRNGEENIDFSYLTKCNDYHDNWISKIENKYIFDGNIDIDTNIYNENKYFTQILITIYSLIYN